MTDAGFGSVDSAIKIEDNQRKEDSSTAENLRLSSIWLKIVPLT